VIIHKKIKTNQAFLKLINFIAEKIAP